MATKNENKTRLIIAIVGLVVVGGLWAGLKGWHNETKYPRGTVLAVDPVARTATIEVIHARSGHKIKLNGNVPENCAITIDDRPAKLGDIRVGDRVLLERVGGDIKKVRVERVKAGGASQPATRTAPAAGA